MERGEGNSWHRSASRCCQHCCFIAKHWQMRARERDGARCDMYTVYANYLRPSRTVVLTVFVSSGYIKCSQMRSGTDQWGDSVSRLRRAIGAPHELIKVTFSKTSFCITKAPLNEAQKHTIMFVGNLSSRPLSPIVRRLGGVEWPLGRPTVDSADRPRRQNRSLPLTLLGGKVPETMERAH